jgi:hypothetical protein
MSSRQRRVTDLALAAYLAATGHRLAGVGREGRRGVFVFEDGPSIEGAMLDFYNRRASVDALTFAELLRNLKAAAQTA